MKSITQKLAAQPKYIFLIDGLGALITTLSLILLIVPFSEFWGTDSAFISRLATATVFFTLYSLSCFFMAGNAWKKLLAIIITANSIYCIITAWMLYQSFNSITLWGIAYFAGEIAVILSLVCVEVYLIRIAPE